MATRCLLLRFFGLSVFLVACSLLTFAEAKEVVLYTFTTIQFQGAYPNAGLIIDKAGNLYGTALDYYAYTCPFGADCGEVFQLSPVGGTWQYSVLQDFTAYKYGGGYPLAPVIMDADGNLYGTNSQGQVSGRKCHQYGCGTVYQLVPSANSWTLNSIYQFNGPPDGGMPATPVVFDSAGNLFGTTAAYGPGRFGTAFELSPGSPSWSYTLLHAFSNGQDGAVPSSGLSVDGNGNLYGTTSVGPAGPGLVYELSPNPDGTWTYTQLYAFHGGVDGGDPKGGLVLDKHGSLYGTTQAGGDLSSCGGLGCGVVFMLSPSSQGWKERVLHSFTGLDGSSPIANLTFDSSGDLYGTTQLGGHYGAGSVFKMAPAAGGWRFNVLYSFTGGSDGSSPAAGVVLDGAGKVYGTTTFGGMGEGVVFQLQP